MNMNFTLIGQLVAFAVFVIFCMKYVWPPLLDAIETRQKKIADGLEASDRAEKDLALAQQNATQQIKEAKAQAAEIVDQAKKRASSLLDEETERARAEREKIVEQGRAEIEAERTRLKEELRKQVGLLAVAGAERILEREINSDAHTEIVDKLVNEL